VTLVPEQKKLLSRMASRLLNLRAGTPITYTRKNLGPQRALLDQMLTGNLVRIVGGQYLPTFRGIEQLDDDIRQLARGNLNYVLGALKRLYSRSDDCTFNFDVIVEEVRRQDPTRDANDVLPALLLGEEFNYYSFQNGIQERDDHLAVQSATVAERILDLTSVEEEWARLIAQEEMDRSRKFEAPVQTVGRSPGSETQEGGLPELQFMRRADLRKIVERDYAELQRVKIASAAKSRYVLCGGLIEALLLDALLCEEAKAKAANKSPKLKGGSQTKPLLDWNLGELIDVVVELHIIETDAEQFSHGVRNYRNLIHPGKEIQSSQKVAIEEADISEKVLEIIMRELRQRNQP
jgi:hypothetical protein